MLFRAIVRDDDPEDDLWGEVAIEAVSEADAQEKVLAYLKAKVEEGRTSLNLDAVKLTVALA